MRLIYLETIDPHVNLATEEYLLRDSSEPCFMLWRNRDSVIIGRNQNTLAEINYELVKEKNIDVVRRMSGGGAVFHDLGNLNYTFIMQNDGNDFNNYAKFCRPIIEALNALGVPAQLSGRNDLLIEERKFSGNAQYVYKDRILHHGTLLFSTDMSRLGEVLQVNEQKMQSKAIQSVRSRVTNILEHLDRAMDVLAFKDYLMDFVAKDAQRYTLTPEEIAAIAKLTEEKYNTWEWNFGYSPKYAFSKEVYLPAGTIQVNLETKEGCMQAVSLRGDFFGRRDISELEQHLVNVKHQEAAIVQALESIQLSDFIVNITPQELSKCFF